MDYGWINSKTEHMGAFPPPLCLPCSCERGLLGRTSRAAVRGCAGKDGADLGAAALRPPCSPRCSWARRVLRDRPWGSSQRAGEAARHPECSVLQGSPSSPTLLCQHTPYNLISHPLKPNPPSPVGRCRQRKARRGVKWDRSLLEAVSILNMFSSSTKLFLLNVQLL